MATADQRPPLPMRSASANQEELITLSVFRIMDLPTEMRLIILEYYFSAINVTISDSASRALHPKRLVPNNSSRRLQAPPTPASVVSMIYVCKQVRLEALPVYLKRLRFMEQSVKTTIHNLNLCQNDSDFLTVGHFYRTRKLWQKGLQQTRGAIQRVLKEVDEAKQLRLI